MLHALEIETCLSTSKGEGKIRKATGAGNRNLLKHSQRGGKDKKSHSVSE